MYKVKSLNALNSITQDKIYLIPFSVARLDFTKLEDFFN